MNTFNHTHYSILERSKINNIPSSDHGVIYVVASFISGYN